MKYKFFSFRIRKKRIEYKKIKPVCCQSPLDKTEKFKVQKENKKIKTKDFKLEFVISKQIKKNKIDENEIKIAEMNLSSLILFCSILDSKSESNKLAKNKKGVAKIDIPIG